MRSLWTTAVAMALAAMSALFQGCASHSSSETFEGFYADPGKGVLKLERHGDRYGGIFATDFAFEVDMVQEGQILKGHWYPSKNDHRSGIPMEVHLVDGGVEVTTQGDSMRLPRQNESAYMISRGPVSGTIEVIPKPDRNKCVLFGKEPKSVESKPASAILSYFAERRVPVPPSIIAQRWRLGGACLVLGMLFSVLTIDSYEQKFSQAALYVKSPIDSVAQYGLCWVVLSVAGIVWCASAQCAQHGAAKFARAGGMWGGLILFYTVMGVLHFANFQHLEVFVGPVLILMALGGVCMVISSAIYGVNNVD